MRTAPRAVALRAVSGFARIFCVHVQCPPQRAKTLAVTVEGWRFSYDLPRLITGTAGNSSEFFYSPGRSRWKHVAFHGGSSETTVYIGGLVEKATTRTITSWKHTIAAGNGPVAIYTRKSSGTNELHYLTKDHLGSVDSISSASGAVEVRLSFNSSARAAARTAGPASRRARTGEKSTTPHGKALPATKCSIILTSCT